MVPVDGTFASAPGHFRNEPMASNGMSCGLLCVCSAVLRWACLPQRRGISSLMVPGHTPQHPTTRYRCISFPCCFARVLPLATEATFSPFGVQPHRFSKAAESSLVAFGSASVCHSVTENQESLRLEQFSRQLMGRTVGKSRI